MVRFFFAVIPAGVPRFAGRACVLRIEPLHVSPLRALIPHAALSFSPRRLLDLLQHSAAA